MKVHELKVLPQYYDRLQSGDKPFEVRRNDRDFQTGDFLRLKYYNPIPPLEVAKLDLFFKVSYILHGGQFGIE